MTDNTFVRALSSSPDLAAAGARREQLYAQLYGPPTLNSARDTLVREAWTEIAVIAHHLAHDQGLADISAAIPCAGAPLSDWDPFFVFIARLAQSTTEPPVNADALRQHGLLPTSCALASEDFHDHAVHLVASLDRGNASCTRHAMQALTTRCTFTLDTAVAPD